MSEHRLDEILIERPRSGMKISSRKIPGNKKFLYQLTREATDHGLLQPHIIKVRDGTKYLSDNLAPLRRYLRSKVGQKWDDIYSELNQRLDRSTISGQHVFDHLWYYVTREVEMIDGLPYQKPSENCWTYQLLVSRYYPQFYVHPETGILTLAPRGSRIQVRIVPTWWHQPKGEVRWVNKYHQYHCLDGIWYSIRFSDFNCTITHWDVLLKAELSRQDSLQRYGYAIYADRKQQCSKRDLKRLKLRVDSPSG
ncbi:hypothetical protein IQ266_07505 [filamentous cyanobacterium LEGE 11480]|uniref:Uncharacterized protein n=1 Tax=Romeriopsis navalis LEGE 11480 TaxID=2777977 RepID=A0A928VKT9_9CYAN|nr:hypothetical protein [Romeriopsis navalis]MBE9029573.1 hypothetical protein [Romeriopsis navalis LEGE 11480]